MLQEAHGKRTARSFNVRAKRSPDACPPTIHLHFDNKSRLVSQIFIKSNPFLAVFDTGATHSCINLNLVNTLNIPLATSPIKSLKLADCSTISVLGSVTLWFTLNSIVLSHNFLVLQSCLDDIILGANFFKQGKLQFIINADSTLTNDTEAALGTLQEMDVDVTEKTSAEETIIQEFLAEQMPRFENMQGPSSVAVHYISMKHDRPIKQRYSPKNPAMQEIINKEVDALLEENRIEPSKSAYSAPICLTKKPNGDWRLCIDYRLLNEQSIRDAYPLPKINYILDQLRNGKYFSKIDLKQGYWQIPMAANSKHLTAFTVPGRGLFQWNVMPFGLHSAPATFQRALDQVIGPKLEPFAFTYLDDIVLIGKTMEEHLENLKIVFDRLLFGNLRINSNKCAFVKPKIKYLGHVISQQGIHTDGDKVGQS